MTAQPHKSEVGKRLTKKESHITYVVHRLPWYLQAKEKYLFVLPAGHLTVPC